MSTHTDVSLRNEVVSHSWCALLQPINIYPFGWSTFWLDSSGGMWWESMLWCHPEMTLVYCVYLFCHEGLVWQFYLSSSTDLRLAQQTHAQTQTLGLIRPENFDVFFFSLPHTQKHKHPHCMDEHIETTAQRFSAFLSPTMFKRAQGTKIITFHDFRHLGDVWWLFQV